MSSLINAIDELYDLERMIAMIGNSAVESDGDRDALYGVQIALHRISKEVGKIRDNLDTLRKQPAADNDDDDVTDDDMAFAQYMRKHHPDKFKKLAFDELAEIHENERKALNQQFADVISEIDETAKAKKSYSLSEAEIDVLTRAAAANDSHLPKQNQGFRGTPIKKKAAPRRKVAKRR